MEKKRPLITIYTQAYNSGKYFAMLDSDDYWTEDNLEKLVQFAEENDLDMTVCGISSFVDTKEEKSILRQPKRELVFETSENAIYFGEIYNYLRTTWGKLIRMDILRKADFTVYKENAKDFISDDTAFTLANYAECERIGAIRDILLCYRFSATSVTARYNPKRIDNNINIYTLSREVLQKLNDTSQSSSQYIADVYWGSVIECCRLLFASNCTYSEKLKEIKRLLEMELVQQLLNSSYRNEKVLEYILSNVLVETEQRENITKEDIEILKCISNLAI